jgi:hypothetical protein
MLRWVEDWSEMRDEMLAIVLGPCGHVIARTARLEWSTGRQLVSMAGAGRRAASS